jgi:hypothetical protein
MSDLKYVYQHRSRVDDSVFYIGCGTKTRPYSTLSRNKQWESIAK